MCEFISSYEESKPLKRRMNKLAEKEEPEREKIEAQPLVTSKYRITIKECPIKSRIILLASFLLETINSILKTENNEKRLHRL
ncbi:MAG: hypothetical protein WBY22_12410 [Nitrososphaeraceae archaeon]